MRMAPCMCRSAGTAHGSRLVASLEASGLTGRGGGAFPASIKLALAHSGGTGGTLVVNAMEGEPCSDKDKLLLTRSPHLVLDGAQHLAGLRRADRIVICIPIGRDGIAAAVSHALVERTRHRYAKVHEAVVRPPDRFIAGEESALANWIESGALFRFSGLTRASRFASGGALHWSTTPRPWPTSLSSPAMVPTLSYPWTSEEPGTCLVTISGDVDRPGGRRGRSRHPSVGHRPTQQASRARASPPGWRIRGGMVGPEHFTLRMPQSRCGRSALRPASGSSWCSGSLLAGWPRQLGSPVTWPTRAPVNAVPASTGSRPSRTIWLDWPGARRPRRHCATPPSSRSSGRPRGMPPPRWSGEPGPKCAGRFRRRHCRPRPG